jgi:hypothetical protein
MKIVMKQSMGLYRLAGALWGMAASVAAYWQLSSGTQQVPAEQTLVYAVAFFIFYLLVVQIGKTAMLQKQPVPAYGWNHPFVLIALAVVVIVGVLSVVR